MEKAMTMFRNSSRYKLIRGERKIINFMFEKKIVSWIKEESKDIKIFKRILKMLKRILIQIYYLFSNDWFEGILKRNGLISTAIHRNYLQCTHLY